MADSEAFQRFQKSKNIGYEQWHDGEGYDLDAFAEMLPEEKDRAVSEILARGGLDFRDMEVLAMHGDRASFDRLRDVLASGTIEERASALRSLIDMGKMQASVCDFQLSHVLDDINGIEGMTVALRIAEGHAGPMSNAALLRGARDRPGVAVHFAGMACYLAGASDDEFDWNLRPLFLKMGEGETDSVRAAAFAELCKWIGVEPSSIPEKGCGTGVAFPRGRNIEEEPERS
jgi:hypothetical protein